MSSTLRRFSQIPVRTKYLIGFGTTSDVQGSTGAIFGNDGASVIRVTNGAYLSIGAVATTTEITAKALAAGATISAYLPNTLINGVLFKDMGRQVTVYNSALPGDLHIATYRECQLVNGGGSEGVEDADPEYGADYYVRVWAADGTGVAVARTG
jgi:hypothetical protein